MSYVIVALATIFLGLYGYIVHLLGERERLNDLVAKKESEASLAKDTQAVQDTTAKVQESTRDYNAIRDAYLKSHPDDKS